MDGSSLVSVFRYNNVDRVVIMHGTILDILGHGLSLYSFQIGNTIRARATTSSDNIHIYGYATETTKQQQKNTHNSRGQGAKLRPLTNWEDRISNQLNLCLD